MLPLSLGLIFLFSLPHEAKAENPVSQENKKIESIYHIEPWTDGGIIALGVGITIFAYADSENLIHVTCPCNPSDVNSFDRAVIGNKNDGLEHISDLTAAAASVFPAVLDYFDVGLSKEFAENMTVYAEVISVNNALVTIAKYEIQRPLPRTYDGDPNLVQSPGGYRSFYSGHTSLTFAALSAAAMTRSLRHEGEWWPWVLTGVVGTSVAYERVEAGRHFYTDVLVGAAIGTTLGILIPKWHHDQKFKDQTIGFMPIAGGAAGLWRFNF